MVEFTQSLERFLATHYPKEMVLIDFGHTELFTEQMKQEYLAWCQTDEGKTYLKGGANYKEV